jgi:signal peptidase I
MAQTSLEITSWWGRALVGRNPRRTLVRICLLVVAAFLTFRYVLIPIRISGPSMQPTYMFGRPNVVNRLAFRFREPKRGDVIGIRMAGERVQLMKRIVGLPGEHVEVRGGVVYINGEALDEPYVKHPAPWERREYSLAADQYYVAGDNRANSENGVIERARILGKVLF